MNYWQKIKPKIFHAGKAIMTDKPMMTQKWIVPSVFDLIVMTIFTTMVLMDPMIKSFDIFWHLRTGDLLLSGVYPTMDIFSYTAYGKPWILHEWGSQVVFAFIYKTAGFSGLIVLKSLIYALMYGLMFRLMLRKNINIFISLVFTLLTVFGTAGGWTVRPHMFTNLFLVVLFWVFLEYKHHGNLKILWFLPVLFLFWINLHGGFIIGFVFLSGCIGAEIWACFMKTGSTPTLKGSQAKRLILWSMAAFAACFINPSTWKGVLYPLMYIGDQMDSKFILEWAAPTIYSNMNFFIYCMLLLLGLAFSGKRPRVYETILVMVFIVFAFSAKRHIPVFSIVVTPILAWLWQDLLISLFKTFQTAANELSRRWLNRMADYFTTRSTWFGFMETHLKYHALLFIVIGTMTAVSVFFPEKLHIGLDSTRYPIDIVDHIKTKNIQGNLFNQYGWGGFLLWALPDHKVFIDGRMDVYKRDVSDPYKTIITLEEGWEELIDKYAIQHILLDKEQIMSRFLLHVSDVWVLEKESDTACFFSKIQKNEEKENIFLDTR